MTTNAAPAAFDGHASGYDRVADSALGTELRRRVHDVVRPLIGPTSDVADLGCGTGIDAAWLGDRVRSVVAVDASTEMVAITEARCQDHPNVAVSQDDLSTITLDPAVDLILMNFGAINCVADLDALGNRLDDSLRPGGHAVAVSMTRWCPIELMVGVATRNRALIRRRHGEPQAATDYGDVTIRYASTSDLAAAFPQFTMVRAEALGTALPPFEQRGWVEDRPRLCRSLATLDRWIAPLGARLGIGDHHIVVLRRP